MKEVLVRNSHEGCSRFEPVLVLNVILFKEEKGI